MDTKKISDSSLLVGLIKWTINEIDKLLNDHLICHDIDYLHVCIVDMIHVGNNTESQLEELLSRKNANGSGI